MSTIRKTKIHFLTLFKREWGTKNILHYPEIKSLLSFIAKMKKLEKQMDIKDSKFCYLDAYNVDKKEPIISGFFTSAKYAYRPNLLDKKTGEERPSPKRITEGEKEKTHFVVKIGIDEVFILLEQNGNGVTINQIVNYLNHYLKLYLKSISKSRDFTIEAAKIGRDDFLKTLNNLKRVQTAEIFFNKSLLGSKFLNFSNRTFSVQNDLILTAKAESRNSIKETAIDFFNTSKSNQSVSKVRIYGTDNNGATIWLDTTFMEKTDSLNLSLNEMTGEVQTTEITSGLIALIKPFK